MSEYWVSKKKYFCQYCEIYIADDAPSRAQHENGLRHKGNKDRFIRGLYKAGVKKKQESEEEKREMKRVEQAAQEAYARDIGAGYAAPSSSSVSTAPSVPAPKPKAPPPKPSDPYTNYTTAASLGITDPDVERLVAEAEVRKNEGRAGDWVAVAPPPPPLPQNVVASAVVDERLEPGGSAGEVRKREEESADDDTRHFKMRKKTVAVGLGEIYDPGIIRIKPRIDPNVKPEETAIASSSSNPIQGPILGGDAPRDDMKGKNIDAGPKATERPAWTRREWKWAGEDEEPKVTSALTQSSGTSVNDESHPDTPQGMSASSEAASAVAKREDHTPSLDSESTDALKREDPGDSGVLSSGSGGSLFRKRKVATGASTRGRRNG